MKRPAEGGSLSPTATPKISWLSAARLASAQTAAFFEAHPFAYEETLDHVLIHNLEKALSGAAGARFIARFAGRAGQVYFPGFAKRREVVDLVLILVTPRVTKLVLLQSKRVFPKRRRFVLPKSSATVFDELKAYVGAELSTPPARFTSASTYESIGKSRAGKISPQWDAIERINAISRATWSGRDAVHYLLHHPNDPTDLSLTTTPSHGRLGLRVVSQTELASAIGGPPVARALKPTHLSSRFASPLSAFPGFLAEASRCHVGLPVDGNTRPAMTILLPGIKYDLRVERETRSDRREPLSIVAERDERPVIDLRSTSVVTLSVDEHDDSWDEGAQSE